VTRTKVFVSYSHVDGAWRDRLLTHLAVLQRLELLDVWIDTRIQFGDDWNQRLDRALAECQVALLLVSANFLAGDFIQNIEMPALLERHVKDGLIILPVIARPCAWRLVDYLARRQSWPQGGKALSLGTEPEIDRDLTLLTYELATTIRHTSPEITTEMESILRHIAPDPERLGNSPRRLRSIELLFRTWTGNYGPIGGTPNRRMLLSIDTYEGDAFRGHAIWPGQRVVTTAIEGTVIYFDNSSAGTESWSEPFLRTHQHRLGVRFTDLEAEGGNLEVHGDYRAVLAEGGTLFGLWARQVGGPPIGQFTLVPNKGR
jgi:hypothetical protein